MIDLNNLENVAAEASTVTVQYGIPAEDYKNLTNVDLSPYKRQKQNLTYIPWGVSLQVLKTYNPSLDVKFVENPNNDSFYFGNSEIGYYLLAYLSKDGQRISENLVHAIRDYRNKAVTTGLDITHITNSAQRAIAKCIAINTGIGMSLYSQIDESIDFIQGDEVITDESYKLWKSQKDGIDWAIERGLTDKEAKEMLVNATPDKQGRKSKAFFYDVLKATKK